MADILEEFFGIPLDDPAPSRVSSRGNAAPDPLEEFFGISFGDRPGAGGKVSREFVVNGLIERGLPAHVAEAFALNIADESGFDPGINEVAPLVKGSRGGFGLIQFTGPRRRELEAAAAARGVSPADPDLQLDRIVEELKTTERRAADRILGTNTVRDAAIAIVSDFLRPAPVNRNRRVRKFQTLEF